LEIPDTTTHVSDDGDKESQLDEMDLGNVDMDVRDKVL